MEKIFLIMAGVIIWNLGKDITKQLIKKVHIKN